jgi:hypothetical protein
MMKRPARNSRTMRPVVAAFASKAAAAWSTEACGFEKPARWKTTSADLPRNGIVRRSPQRSAA